MYFFKPWVSMSTSFCSDCFRFFPILAGLQTLPGVAFFPLLNITYHLQIKNEMLHYLFSKPVPYKKSLLHRQHQRIAIMSTFLCYSLAETPLLFIINIGEEGTTVVDSLNLMKLCNPVLFSGFMSSQRIANSRGRSCFHWPFLKAHIQLTTGS